MELYSVQFLPKENMQYVAICTISPLKLILFVAASGAYAKDHFNGGILAKSSPSPKKYPRGSPSIHANVSSSLVFPKKKEEGGKSKKKTLSSSSYLLPQ